MARAMPPTRTDDGWPYPDGAAEPAADDEIDLDILELRADPHLFDALDAEERSVLLARFGLLDGRARPMKELARDHAMTHTQVRVVLERALDKIRHRLAALDEG